MVKIIFLLIYYIGRGHTHNGQFVSPKKIKRELSTPPLKKKKRVLMSDVIENNERKSNINIKACLSMTF